MDGLSKNSFFQLIFRKQFIIAWVLEEVGGSLRAGGRCWNSTMWMMAWHDKRVGLVKFIRISSKFNLYLLS